MTFADLIAGEAIFLDANPFVYHFVADPQYGAACSQLFQRVETRRLQGLTSTHVLTEMAHRIMTVEAISAFNWPMSGIARRLRQHPSPGATTREFHQAVERILQSRIQVLTIPFPLIAAGAQPEPADRASQQRRPDRGGDAGQRPDSARQFRSGLRPGARVDPV